MIHVCISCYQLIRYCEQLSCYDDSYYGVWGEFFAESRVREFRILYPLTRPPPPPPPKKKKKNRHVVQVPRARNGYQREGGFFFVLPYVRLLKTDASHPSDIQNLIRLFDIAYDGYNGGKDDVFVSWTDESGHNSYNALKSASQNTTQPYMGPSIMVMAFPVNKNDRQWQRNWPSPIVFHDSNPGKPVQQEPNYVLDPDNVERVFDERMRVFGQLYNRTSTDPTIQKRYERYYRKMPNFTYQHTTKKSAGQAVAENESTGNSLAFQGTYRVWLAPNSGQGGGGTSLMDVKGSGHHGVDYIGVASVRSGKGYKVTGEGLKTVRQV
jgi:hypothetical protein